MGKVMNYWLPHVEGNTSVLKSPPKLHYCCENKAYTATARSQQQVQDDIVYKTII